MGVIYSQLLCGKQMWGTDCPEASHTNGKGGRCPDFSFQGQLEIIASY